MSEPKKVVACHNTVYFLGFVGSLVWYLQHSSWFWGWVAGFLKALVWPALLAYKALEFLSRTP